MLKFLDSQALAAILFVVAAILVTAIVAFLFGARVSEGRHATHRETPGVVSAEAAPAHGAVHGAAPSGEHVHEAGEHAPHTETAPESPVEQAIRAAMNALQPASGMAALEQALASLPMADDERARIHVAMGRLAAVAQPPLLELEQSSFALAASLTQTSSTRAALARAHGEILMDRKDYAAAVAVVREALEELPPAAVERLSLRIFLGALLEMNQNGAEAEAVYRLVLEEARGLQEVAQRDMHLRQAALHLSRLYRAGGRYEEADELAKRIGAEVGEGAPALAPDAEEATHSAAPETATPPAAPLAESDAEHAGAPHGEAHSEAAHTAH
jgi:tetratricopeptide (TPR) repeat protein